MIDIVYEYRLNKDGYCLGWSTIPAHKRPDLKDIPEPLPEMKIDGQFDSQRRIFVNGKIFRLENNAWIAESHSDPVKNYRKNWPHDKIIDALCKGIADKNDQDYLDFLAAKQAAGL